MAQQHEPMYMVDWIKKLDEILKLNARELLTHAGKISHQVATDKANQEFDKYQVEQNKIAREQNFAEIEQDIKKLKKQYVKKQTS